MLLREWLIITLVFGFLISIIIISDFSQVTFHSKQIEKQKPQLIKVTLSGAVDNPGEYECEPGISLKNLLERAKVSKSANRKKIPFKKILISSQQIKIPKKKKSISEKKKISLEEN